MNIIGREPKTGIGTKDIGKGRAKRDLGHLWGVLYVLFPVIDTFKARIPTWGKTQMGKGSLTGEVDREGIVVWRRGEWAGKERKGEEGEKEKN